MLSFFTATRWRDGCNLNFWLILLKDFHNVYHLAHSTHFRFLGGVVHKAVQINTHSNYAESYPVAKYPASCTVLNCYVCNHICHFGKIFDLKLHNCFVYFDRKRLKCTKKSNLYCLKCLINELKLGECSGISSPCETPSNIIKGTGSG